MLERLARTCEGCDRRLEEADRRLTFEPERGCVRHAYECRCGAVTITVARGERG
jgi:hypothetical protein